MNEAGGTFISENALGILKADEINFVPARAICPLNCMTILSDSLVRADQTKSKSATAITYCAVSDFKLFFCILLFAELPY